MRRSALRLSMSRLGGTLGGRVGWLGALGVALVFASGSSSGEDLSVQAVRVLCWVAAGPVALAAARSPSERDRADGIELLAATRGIDRIAWRRTRMLAAALSCALRVLVPTLVVASTVLIVSASFSTLATAVGAVLAGTICGALIGALAALCGEVGAERGRSLFAAVVLLPWLLSDLWSVPGLSLVGALDAGLSMIVEVAALWG